MTSKPSSPRTEPAAQVRWLAVYAALTYPFVCVPFLYFHFHESGLSPAEYAQIIAVYYVTMVVAEVPTGMLADVRGKKVALVLGPLLLAAGFLLFAAGSTFAVFSAGQAVLGIGHAILSGPPSALLYDTLRQQGRSGEFLREESRLQAIRLLGTGVSFLAGGVIVRWYGIEAAIVATAALNVLAAAVALCLRDVPAPLEESGAHAARLPLLRTAREDLASPTVRWTIAYYLILFILLRYAFHTYQPYLLAADRTEPLLVGTLFFALNLCAAPFSHLLPVFRDRLGERLLLWVLPLSLSMTLLAMAFLLEHAGWWLFFVQQVPFGMHWALVQDRVNQALRSATRATVLSVMSFAGRLVFAGVFPLAGWLHEAHGIEAAYLTMGAAGTVATCLCLRALR